MVLRGGLSSPTTFGRSVVNGRFTADLYLNLAKGFGSFSLAGGNTPEILNADQYPAGVLAANYSGNVSIDPTYYGHYTLQWTGTSGFQLSPPVIVYSGGNSVVNVSPSNTGSTIGNSTINTNANPNVEFSFGGLIAGVSGGSGSLVTIQTSQSLFFTGISTGTNVKLGVGVSSNLANGPNTDGSWTVTNVDATHFTLNGSTGVASPTVTATGGPGAQSEAILSLNQVSVSFMSTIPGIGTITHAFSNFILCKTADLTDIAAGKQVSQAAINSLIALKPKYVRYMDMMATQAFYSDFNYRYPVTGLLYNSTSQWVPSLYVSPMGGTGDSFTVPNPGYQTGSYVDGEIVQFTASRSSTTNKPTLNVGTRGAVPIFSSSYTPLWLPISGAPTTGDVITITFTASYLPSGSHAFAYTVLSSDTSIDILGASIATALAADIVLAGCNFQFGYSGQGAVYSYLAPANGPLTVTSSTSGSATELCTPGTTPAGATVLFSLVGPTFVSGSSYTCIYNALLKGWVVTGDNSGLASGVPLEIIKEISIRANVGAWLCPPMPYTQASYNLLGAWAATNLPGIPVLVEPMNEVWNTSAAPLEECLAQGACLGFAATGGDFFRAPYSFYGLVCAQNLPAFATGYTGAGGTRSNLSLCLQNWALDPTGNPSNSSMIPYRWNGGLLSSAPASGSSCTISGTTLTVGGTVVPFWFPGQVLSGVGVTSCRIQKQLTGTSSSAGTYQISVSQTVSSPVAMIASNPLYAAVAGPNGTAGTSYNAFPNRPIDSVDSIGYACYWSGALTSGRGNSGFGAGAISGTQSNFDVLFQASLDFANGLTAQALNAWDADQRAGTYGGVLGSVTPAAYISPTISGGSGNCQAFENLCAGYDGAGRPSGKANLSVIQYEGGYSTTLAANYQNPTNATTSPAELNTQFTANGWTLSPTYGASNLDVATNMVNLAIAYQGSSQFAATQLYFYQQMALIHAARPNFSPAEYGMEGPSAWELYPGNLSTKPWQNYNAIAAYNH